MKTLKIKITTVLIVGACVLATIFISGRLTTFSARKALRQATITLLDSIRHYEVTVNSFKLQVYEKNTIILNRNKAIKAGLLERERLRKLNLKRVRTNSILKGEIKVLKDSLELTEPQIVYVKDSAQTDSVPCVILPISDEYSDKDLKLDMWINRDASWGFDLCVPVDLEITIAENKSLVTTDNKYLTVRDVNFVYVPPKVPFYERAWFFGLAATAVAGGVILLSK